jgi:dTDP-4-amino-4,6-dideoxygalactose transaminase
VGSRLLGRGDPRAELRDELARAIPGWSPLLLHSARYGLALAVERLGLAGGAIAVPAYVCPAVLTALRAAGARPVGVDMQDGTLRMDLFALRRLVQGEGVDGILAPACYGSQERVSELRTLGLPVIEDAAYQAGWRDSRGRWCGTLGDLGVWSFNFKSQAGIGGGVLWSRGASPELADSPRPSGERRRALGYALRSLCAHSLPRALGGAPQPKASSGRRAPLEEFERWPMSRLQAAINLAQWRRREDLAGNQEKNVAALCEALMGTSRLRPLDAGARWPHFLPLVTSVAQPSDALFARRALYQAGVQTEDPYPRLVGRRGEFPVAEQLRRRLVLVPCHAGLSRVALAHVQTGLRTTGRALDSRPT